MELNEYQSNALKSYISIDNFKVEENKILYPLLGLAGETGEVVEKYKKVIRDKGGVLTDEDKKHIIMELGDVLWYVSALTHDLGYSLEEVGVLNNAKTFSRLSRGKIHGNGDYR